jgi:ABC-2 type transport system permease protein
MPVSKLGFIALKEVRHLLRDTRSLMIAILMPLMMTLLYGYAINLDIKDIKLAVFDYDRTPESRDLVNRFYNSGYFTRADSEPGLEEPDEIFKTGDAHCIFTIKPGFAEALRQGEGFEVGLLLDGADANMTNAASSYAGIVMTRFLQEQLPPGFEIPGVRLSLGVLYNPDLKSSHFFVLGLIAIILMLVSALLTSLTIAREKETGTLEQLLTAPVRPREIILGKVIPYFVLASFDGFLVWAFAVFHFGVPMNGSILLMVLFGTVYVLAALSIGILVSTLVRSQQVAMMTTLMVTMMPSVLLSGFAFDLGNMPRVLQAISYIVPARYFIVIIRGVMLKGSGLGVLWPQAAALAVLAFALLAIAAKKFTIRIG